ncbi:MAG: UDP-N-acetylglucosamine 1-carboxyvinyltransferase [Eubacteriales bacterium]|nr:UDP-N-acetylglucosamine 1-carboxyvinyltransferase [Clostridiales bacterium]MDD7773950.1 UDP-N-acetylglucosamine 1-carboxyvinyltransferase [Eubacteriales bacterium]MDY3940823.1 UDP-N-acetylglucosamine 1-carboxyvinyltransferase [Eubacteriales bacterium]
MEKIVVHGGVPLMGSVEVSGSKNAALPIIYACALVPGKVVLENIPNISDINCSFTILRGMGAEIRMLDRTTYEIDCTHLAPGTSDYELVRKLRGSYYLLGAEFGRFGKARVGLPGGCDFGVRPIDQHIKGFEALGGEVSTEGGYIDIRSENGARGTNIFFDVSSVGATINIMIAAATAEGVTIIDNAAREPHVVDCAQFLNTCGANISGAGSDVIKIRGVKELHGCSYAIIPDMIEAGSFMVAAAATGGSVRINNVIPKHLESITAKLLEVGVDVEEFDEAVHVTASGKIRRTSIKTLPYPGFPTDMHPQMTALLLRAEGVSYINESIFENRFRYVEELRRMGAQIKVEGRIVTIEGGAPLSAAPVMATDLRGGIAVMIAALMCSGQTEITESRLIERGYDDICGKLRGLGADIRKIQLPDPAVKKAN